MTECFMHKRGCVCVSYMRVCSLWPPLTCQAVLAKVAVSSIHICASAQGLSSSHQTENVGNRRRLCVVSDNNSQSTYETDFVSAVVVSPQFGSPAGAQVSLSNIRLRQSENRTK